MANFSLEDVKTLRERLGNGMVDTKNALVEAEGDIEKCEAKLRNLAAAPNVPAEKLDEAKVQRDGAAVRREQLKKTLAALS